MTAAHDGGQILTMYQHHTRFLTHCDRIAAITYRLVSYLFQKLSGQYPTPGGPSPSTPGVRRDPFSMRKSRHPRKPWSVALLLTAAATLTSGGFAAASAGAGGAARAPLPPHLPPPPPQSEPPRAPAGRARPRLPHPLRRALPADRPLGCRRHGRRHGRHWTEVLHAGLPH